AEMLVAYLVLADRRFELAFEAYGAGRSGPDLTATYRANQRLNLEVTRLRLSAAPDKLATVIAAKLRQLPGEIPNALVITTREMELTEATIEAAFRLLKARAEDKDDPFFARHGLRNTRDFRTQFGRLSVIFTLDEGGDASRVSSTPNRE